MRKPTLFAACLALTLGTAACDEQPTAPTVTPLDGAAAAVTSEYGLERGALAVPANGRIADPFPTDLAGRAIDPDDYVCPASTPVVDWYLTAVYDVWGNEPEIFELLYFDLLADLVPTYDALFFETNATPQYFGYDGEYTQVLVKTEKDAHRFWDIDASAIQLIGLHGTMLFDTDRVSRVYNEVFGVPAATADFFASLVLNAMTASERLNGGNHPLFSFNAFAFGGGGPIPPKIIMGDGIMAGYAELGFGDVAPQAVYMHEFAHHIQFQNGYFEDPFATEGDEPEQTRYTEMMADAMSAYFLTHKRGLALNRKRVEQFLAVFYQIGDCAYTNPGHHGTPNQRMAAAQFGFDIAAQAQMQGHILGSEEFHDLFVAVYPDLIAPDAP